MGWGWFMSELTLAGTFDSVCSCWDSDGLRVVEIFLLFGAEAVVSVVLESGHSVDWVGH